MPVLPQIPLFLFQDRAPTNRHPLRVHCHVSLYSCLGVSQSFLIFHDFDSLDNTGLLKTIHLVQNPLIWLFLIVFPMIRPGSWVWGRIPQQRGVLLIRSYQKVHDSSKCRGVYTYGWFMLRFNRKQQNSVKELSFKKYINKLKKKKKKRKVHDISMMCSWCH